MASDGEPILSARAVAFGFTPRTTFLGPLDLDISAGSLCAIVGPNGAGKSTLLRVLAGLNTPRAGRVGLKGRRLSAYGATERARLLAFLPQHPSAPELMRAEEIVRLGRYPYRSFNLFESPGDLDVVRDVMVETATQQFAGRRIESLSGGEAQRVHLAAALAQQPEVLLLDEPTSDLDLYHQLAIFSVLSRLAHERRLAVVVVTHDLNLAMQHCDRVVLLSAGQLLASGSPDDVFNVAALNRVYGVEFATVEIGDGRRPWLVARPVAHPPSTGTDAARRLPQ